MPRPGFGWRHIVISTHGSWLPGDSRGFRSRDHRIHSSGDYQHRPPADEHAGLRAYHRQRAGAIVLIPQPVRAVIGRALLEKMRQENISVLALAVTATHAHLLAEMPVEIKQIRAIMGRCKGFASHAARTLLSGRIWGQAGGYKPVFTPEHQARVYQYILKDQGEGAWTWDFREGKNPGLKPTA